MGKTARGKEEQELLVSEIIQAKKRIHDNSATLFPIQMENISNHIFLYESGQPKEEYFWQQLAEFVRINRTDLPEDQGYRMGNGLNTDNVKVLEKQKKTLFDICEPQYDRLRQDLMPIAYTLQKWLRQYFIPASKVRDDVVIPNVYVLYLQYILNNTNCIILYYIYYFLLETNKLALLYASKCLYYTTGFLL